MKAILCLTALVALQFAVAKPSTPIEGCLYSVIVPSDGSIKTCDQFAAIHGTTFAKLRDWNYDLRSDCANLDMGNAICVKGPANGATVQTMRPKTPATAKSPSPPPKKETKPRTIESTKPANNNKQQHQQEQNPAQKKPTHQAPHKVEGAPNAKAPKQHKAMSSETPAGTTAKSTPPTTPAAQQPKTAPAATSEKASHAIRRRSVPARLV
ncbi:hypothetical protein BGW42_000142 [Actinomortierella wolfii]|nr:hypothetical protein BGW42_000142 [Actinomortierella wolfii]